MKNKIVFFLHCLWSGVVAFTSPICLGMIFLCISGHGKGFAYDLGSEKNISILLGVVGLVLWLLLALPSSVYVLKKLYRQSPYLIAVYVLLFVLLAFCCIGLMGGWQNYMRAFRP